jgi:hypothetical protein
MKFVTPSTITTGRCTVANTPSTTAATIPAGRASDEPATARQRAIGRPVPAWDIVHHGRPLCGAHFRPLDSGAEPVCIVGWSKGETCEEQSRIVNDHTPVFPVFGYPEPF